MSGGSTSASSARLSPAEERIARLVATGRTNKAVAEELDVSAKTVEWNLTRVYRKLGVRSRTELAMYIARAITPGNSPGLREPQK